MTRSKFRPFRTVTAKLFGGFMMMALLIASVGGYALISISSASSVVEETFDRPLMAVNFARAASQTFAALELETLRPSNPGNPEAAFTLLEEDFAGELGVARERSIAPRAEEFFDAVDTGFTAWKIARRDPRRQAESVELALEIEESLDIIVELQANESFRNRESAIIRMKRLRDYSAVAVIAALFLAVGLTAAIAWTIIRPLKAAASVASKISEGRFDVDVPSGREDETGQLLRVLDSMQANIRERMTAEQDLRALAQNRLADSLENSKDALLLSDANGRIILANSGVAQLFPDCDDVAKLIAAPRASLLSNDGVPLHLGDDGERDGDEFRMPDGRWFRVSASETREGGQLFIWTEATALRKTAERLRLARDAAEAASRAKTLFLAAMSHELNTPLNAIIGLSDVLRLRHVNSGETEAADLARLITQSGDHMAGLVRDVLEIASDDTQPDDRSMEKVDLSLILDRAVRNLSELAAQAEVTVLWTPPEEPVFALGDAQDLETLTLKLLDNAIKFNRPGGRAMVQVTDLAEAGLRLDVVDSGIGIAAEDFERIRQPFTQINEGYTRDVGGTGLGLCVAERIAQRHGSELQMRSSIGKGSVFSVSLTRYDSDATGAPPNARVSSAEQRDAA